MNGTISEPLDVDILRITVKAGDEMEFGEKAASGSSLSALLRLFDSRGRQLAANSKAAANSLGLNSAIVYTFRTAGTYYLGVSSSTNSLYSAITGIGDLGGGSTGRYVLEILFP